MALAQRTLLLLAAALAVSATAAAVDADGWMRPGPSSCGGTVGECLGVGAYDAGGDDGEFGLRRRLNYDDEEGYGGSGSGSGYPTQYISYAALMRGSVPCSVPGASYYNCEPGTVANPYSRGCSAITQCRG